MKIAVLIVSRNRPDLVRAQVEWLRRNSTLDHDVYVVEAGTDDDKLCEYSTIRYADDEFRGKAYAHNVALEHARKAAREGGFTYDYHWVLMNDVVFEEGVDAMRILVDQMEAEPRIGVLSPTCEDREYPGSARRPEGGWRPVTTCDYLGFMIRGEVVETIGFLNPDFRYCWGAIHELSFLLHSSGYCVAYSDDVEYRHLGGTTYGARGTNTISREEYQRRAKRFAFTYFNRVYGADWARVFRERAAAFRPEVDTYSEHEAYWMTALEPNEIAALKGATDITPAPNAPAAGTTGLKLHLGCGPDKREGWVNVDVNEQFAPDLVADAHSLPTLPDGSCAAIEACHLFEHLTPTQAKAALTEWRRLLAPGGELLLELPDLDRCIALIGTEMNGYDLGMISLFGYPPEVDAEGAPQLHKWGWTPTTLRAAMLAAGFDDVEEVAITQTHRPAARFDRDMRLVARVARPAAAPAPSAPAPTPAASDATDSGEQPAQMTKVLAWPRYDDEAEMERFFHVFARVLEGREDVMLFLRVDPERDPSQAEVIGALERAHTKTLGEEALVNVQLLEGPITDAEWREMGPLLACRIRTGDESAPRDAARQVPAPVVNDAASLHALLTDARCGAPADSEVDATAAGQRPEDNVIVPAGQPCDAALTKEIASLQPWFYPVTIDGHTVIPGLGSVCAPEWLASRAAHRATLLVGEVLRTVDMRGKKVLDLACNCAFWSSHYAEAGAASVLGVEGRPRHVDQANLYWSRERFLPEGRYEFRVGNIAERSAWPAIEADGPFDVTLCAGILYHVPNYAEILEWAAAVTNEVLIVDTRVQDGAEEIVTEPGDLTFNAIRETRDKVVPDRKSLLATLERLGFAAEVVPPSFDRALGVDDVDSYADGNRVTIIARKAGVPAGAAS